MLSKAHEVLKNWAYNHKHFGLWVLLLSSEEEQKLDEGLGIIMGMRDMMNDVIASTKKTDSDT